MKVSILHKAFSVVLTFLVLFSTLSFTVEKHYCGDSLVDVAVFSEAKKCGGMDAEDEVYVKNSCCKDTIDELNTADFDYFNKNLKITLFAYVLSFTNLFESLPKSIIPHKDYSPPNIVKDIQVLDETFLI